MADALHDIDALRTTRPAAQANQAVWLTAKRGPLQLAPAPDTTPGANEIVVRNHAIALNPVDWLIPTIGGFICPWLGYPAILGSDIAGEVIAVGSAVSRFKPGDRVLGHATSLEKVRNNPAEGAFQNRTVLLEHMAAPIPDTMAYEAAAVLPLGLSTAACGLFQQDYLALSHPAAHPAPTGKTLLVWGGSTSVGCNAIQLAVAAGYEVITTASPTNFAYVRSLGASLAFDYRSSTVIADIVRAFTGRTIAGALAIGIGSAAPCLTIVGACQGDKCVAMASPPIAVDQAPAGIHRALWLVPTLSRMLAANVSQSIKARRGNIRTKFIWGGALVGNEVGPLIYRDFLPAALAERRYRAAPAPLIVGHGLPALQAALEAPKPTVSARKIVVTL